jgi:nicotinamide phosphoribosyltransferase
VNPILTDSYKLSHWKQYPPDTETVYSYLEARGGPFPRTTFFGLQYFLKKYLQWPVRYKDVLDADALAAAHFGRDDLFNLAGWTHILEKHHGYLPLRICALPEGSKVPIGTPLVTVENTCPDCFWLTNYVETLLVQTWYPTTVATVSAGCREIIRRYLDQTGDPAHCAFKLHDFGFRGVSSPESAGLGGCAHLVNFSGTDTLPALQVARDYYGEYCGGFSIPASEHSTITAWGRAHEREAFANMLDQYPEGLVACVSDSYDIWLACEQLWGSELKDTRTEQERRPDRAAR